MCVSCRPNVNDILSVEYWSDLKMWARSCSASLKMAPFDRSHTSSYSFSITIHTIWPHLVLFSKIEIKRDIRQKRQFSIPLPFNLYDHLESF